MSSCVVSIYIYVCVRENDTLDYLLFEDLGNKEGTYPVHSLFWYNIIFIFLGEGVEGVELRWSIEF